MDASNISHCYIESSFFLRPALFILCPIPPLTPSTLTLFITSILRSRLDADPIALHWIGSDWIGIDLIGSDWIGLD